MKTKDRFIYGILILFVSFLLAEGSSRACLFSRNNFKKDKIPINYANFLNYMSPNSADRFYTVWDYDSRVYLSKRIFDKDKYRIYKYKPNIDTAQLSVIFPWGKRKIFSAIDEAELHNQLEINGIEYSIISRLSTDKYGIRNNEVEYDYSASKRNIVNLGDSFTEGLYVDNYQTFSSRLQTLIKDRDYQIINAGLNGYSAHNSYYALVELQKYFKNIEIVIFNFFPNDISNDYHRVLDLKRGPSRHNTRSRFLNYIINDSKIPIVSPLISYVLYKIENERIESGWRDAFKNLQKMRSFCERNKIRLIISVIPAKEQIDFNESRKFYQEKIKTFCAKENIVYIDALNETTKDWYFEWDEHFSATGHEMYSRTLYKHIKDYL